MRGRALVIAGSDSGGGAGLQADIKTITALGGFAMTAVTALTAQNTLGVCDVLPIPAEFIKRQIAVVMEDLGADVIKIGMLGDGAAVKAVSDALRECAPEVPVVLDPVMIAKGGRRLLSEEAVTALRSLLPRVALLTPNLPEAEALTGMSIRNLDEMEAAALALSATGARAVLLKGGHLDSDIIVDMLAIDTEVHRFSAPRIQTVHTHGTGCTLASAIAIGMVQGLTLQEAVTRGREYVRAAIASAPGFGHGHGPLNHCVTHLLPNRF
jgi:hydroxymethylpyrimidine/phosphomethylpyrimidine kinase